MSLCFLQVTKTVRTKTIPAKALRQTIVHAANILMMWLIWFPYLWGRSCHISALSCLLLLSYSLAWYLRSHDKRFMLFIRWVTYCNNICILECLSVGCHTEMHSTFIIMRMSGETCMFYINVRSRHSEVSLQISLRCFLTKFVWRFLFKCIFLQMNYRTVFLRQLFQPLKMRSFRLWLDNDERHMCVCVCVSMCVCVCVFTNEYHAVH